MGWRSPCVKGTQSIRELEMTRCAVAVFGTHNEKSILYRYTRWYFLLKLVFSLNEVVHQVLAISCVIG